MPTLNLNETQTGEANDLGHPLNFFFRPDKLCMRMLASKSGIKLSLTQVELMMAIIILESIGFSATHSISNMLSMNGKNYVSHGSKISGKGTKLVNLISLF